VISGTHYSAVIKRPVSSSYGMYIDFVLQIIISSFSCACLTEFFVYFYTISTFTMLYDCGQLAYIKFLLELELSHIVFIPLIDKND